MPIETIYLIGSGGHSLVVIDSLLETGVEEEAIVVFDHNPERVGHKIYGLTVRAFDMAQLFGSNVHLCIGDNNTRASLAKTLIKLGCTFYSIIHPRAIISKSATIGAGSFVAPGAIIEAQVVIGKNCIINHGAIIDHQCIISDFVHIAPGTTLAGSVKVGQNSFIGAGANILPGIVITTDVIIGAGAVLLRDATEHGTYVGIPARKN